MSLLDDITTTALDPDYARAAAIREAATRAAKRDDASGDAATRDAASRGAAGRTTPGRRRTGLATFVVLMVPGLLIAVAVVHAQRGAPALARQHDRLVASIRDRAHTADRLRRQAADLRADVTALRRERLTHSRRGRAAQRDLTAAARSAALAPATGDGVRVTVNDAAPRASEPGARVYDRDLQTLVNGLWAAGATAIAVNGQRITSTTAIREAGASILVDFRPVSPPYRLDALGDPDTIQPRLADSAAGRRMHTLANTFGIRYDIHPTEDLHLPAGTATTLRYARTAPP